MSVQEALTDWQCPDCECRNAWHEAFCYRCGAGRPEHVPVALTKWGSAYTTDEGEEVEDHLLFRYECSCGWKGAAWYASKERARGHFERHAGMQS